MRTISRRMLLGSAGAGLAAPALAQDPRLRTLRFVPQANLTSLDPIWTTATVTGNHGYYVFDTLYSLDRAGRPQPQMAAGHEVLEEGRRWRITLRPGLLFHDATPVRARDCVQSLRRFAARDPFGQLLAAQVEEWLAPDDRTLEIRLKRPFPLLLELLGKTENPAFMMPERLARTDPGKQVTEMVGSGPYRFVADEYNSGSRVVYAKFDGYVPRPEPPEMATGAKIAHFERVVWSVIPDPATAAAALTNGEVDWWERPLADLQPMLAKAAGVRREVLDIAGRLALARPNCLHPPFDDVRLRRAFLASVIQENYMRATQGDDSATWRPSRSIWPAGTPYFQDNADLMPGDLDRARAMLKEAGYGGQRVVIINPTDFPDIGPLGQVSADALGQIGMKVDLQESDWGTVIQRRNSREPVQAGGWSLFHTTGGTGTYGSPAISPLCRGLGTAGWFGWWQNERAEQLTQDWLFAPDGASQQAAAHALGRLALAEVATVPLGVFTIRTAYRDSLTGLLKGVAPYPWNVRRT